MPSLSLVEGWHAPAGRRTCETPASDPGQADQTGSAGGARKPGPGRQIVSQDSPSGVSRIGVRPGPRPLSLTPAPPQNRGSRAGSTIHSLPADSERLAGVSAARGVSRRSSAYGSRTAQPAAL